MAKSKYGDRFRGWMPRNVVKELGLRAYNDPDELRPICEKVVVENPKQVAIYRSGKDGILGYFIKQVMDVTQSGANAEITKSILEKLLKGGDNRS
jgi:aspartyl-tRNA(Asn)/glutamyl-tRNA(Gln) amidotransferase subunit B